MKQHAPPEIAAPPVTAVPEAPAAAPSAATEAAAKQLGEAIVASSALLREQGCREQLFYLVNFTNVATDEYQRCSRDLTTAHDQTQAVTKERTQCLQRAGERQEEAFRLQAELQAATAVRPGWSALTVWPAGQTGGEHALFGGIALLAGAGAGLLGRPPIRSRLRAGAIGALIALLVFFGFVALLPDTRLTELLLALAGTMLVTALGALLRVSLLLKRRGPEPHLL